MLAYLADYIMFNRRRACECRTLCTALFGQEATALNQPLVVHGDEDGSVRFVPLLVSTPSLSRPRLLFEMKVFARPRSTTPRGTIRALTDRLIMTLCIRNRLKT